MRIKSARHYGWPMAFKNQCLLGERNRGRKTR